MKLQVYLNFKGQSEEAVNYYAKVLNAEQPKILKFSDLPPNPEFPPIPEEFKNYVMHTEVHAGNVVIQLSDVIDGLTPFALEIGNNMSIALILDSSEEINTIYNNLLEDSNIIMPLSPTMWAEGYAYLIDKFGTPWQLNFPGKAKFGH